MWLHGRSQRHRRPTGEPPPLPHEFSRGNWVLFGSMAVFVVLWLWAIADDETRMGIWFNEREGQLLLTSIAGILVLGWAPTPIFAVYGILTAVMIACALLVTLLVLPGLLLLVTPSLKGEESDRL